MTIDQPAWIEFEECSNYRGTLQVKEEDGVCFWRVDCDLDDGPWIEIPLYLWEALMRHHSERGEPAISPDSLAD